MVRCGQVLVQLINFRPAHCPQLGSGQAWLCFGLDHLTSPSALCRLCQGQARLGFGLVTFMVCCTCPYSNTHLLSLFSLYGFGSFLGAVRTLIAVVCVSQLMSQQDKGSSTCFIASDLRMLLLSCPTQSLEMSVCVCVTVKVFHCSIQSVCRVTGRITLYVTLLLFLPQAGACCIALPTAFFIVFFMLNALSVHISFHESGECYFASFFFLYNSKLSVVYVCICPALCSHFVNFLFLFRRSFQGSLQLPF